jgi:hypothetical protein
VENFSPENGDFIGRGLATFLVSVSPIAIERGPKAPGGMSGFSDPRFRRKG